MDWAADRLRLELRLDAICLFPKARIRWIVGVHWKIWLGILQSQWWTSWAIVQANRTDGLHDALELSFRCLHDLDKHEHTHISNRKYFKLESTFDGSYWTRMLCLNYLIYNLVSKPTHYLVIKMFCSYQLWKCIMHIAFHEHTNQRLHNLTKVWNESSLLNFTWIDMCSKDAIALIRKTYHV